MEKIETEHGIKAGYICEQKCGCCTETWQLKEVKFQLEKLLQDVESMIKNCA